MPTWSERAAGGRCVVIGEVAQSHDGSLGQAHAFIDAIANAGADAVKFQTHIAAAESTLGEPWRVRFSRQDATRYDYWHRMEFSVPQWEGLKRHADERQLLFLSSPFSIDAVELLERVGVAAWKVASGETSNLLMVERVAGSGNPVLLSSGLSPLEEIDAAVATVKRAGQMPIVMQCTTAYPCPPDKVGLNLLTLFKSRYGCPVGLSDHSGTIYPGLAAATMGIAALEAHVTFSREMFGPDVAASVTTGELRQLVDGVRFIEAMQASPVDKDAAAVDAGALRTLFTKSVSVRRPLARGTVLSADDLTLKKPGTGIPAAKLGEVAGKRLRRDVGPHEVLADADLEHA